ncbi:MAG: hypothetical protein RLO50_00565 [Azospirillaceae bacterium]
MQRDDFPTCHDYVREVSAVTGGRKNALAVLAFFRRSVSGPCSGVWRHCARSEIAGLPMRLPLGDDARIREGLAFLDALLDDVEDPTAFSVVAILAGCVETGALPVLRELYRRALDWARASDEAKDTALVHGCFAGHLANAGDVDGAVAALRALISDPLFDGPLSALVQRAVKGLPAGSLPRDIDQAIADADWSAHDAWLAERGYPRRDGSP